MELILFLHQEMILKFIILVMEIRGLRQYLLLKYTNYVIELEKFMDGKQDYLMFIQVLILGPHG